jgi:hypothetical protein
MPIMFAAFCAWDGGGELARAADYNDVWTQMYPWGPNDIQRPNYNWCNGRQGNGGFTCQLPAGQTPFYAWPANTNELTLEVWIAAPGRFPLDATSAKSNGESWMDLMANLAEYTGEFSASGDEFCDFSGTPVGGPTCTRADRPGQVGTRYQAVGRVGLLGSSWEGHQYHRNNLTNVWPTTAQYGKFGARCARSLP